MAISIGASLLQEHRLAMMMINEGFENNRPELKQKETGALKCGLDGASKFSPLNLEAIKQASSQNVRIPYYTRIADGAGTVRTASGDFEGGTGYTDITLTGITESFKLSELQHMENELTRDMQIVQLYNQKFRSLADRMDAYVLSQLDANRTQVSDFATNGSMTWNGTTFQMEVPATDRDRIYSNLSQMARVNTLGMDGLRLVTSSGLYEVTSFNNAQGSANGTNLMYNQAMIDNLYYSPAIVEDPALNYTAYAMREGAYGAYTWTNELHRRSATNGWQVWDVVQHPLYGFNIEIYMETARADNSGTVTGAEVDMNTTVSMHVDLAFASAFGTNTDIYKIAQS